MSLLDAIGAIFNPSPPSKVEQRWTQAGEMGWCVIHEGRPINFGNDADSESLAVWGARMIDAGYFQVKEYIAWDRIGKTIGTLQIEIPAAGRFTLTPDYELREPPKEKN